MMIKPQFTPVSTEFEVLAMRRTRSSLNSCIYGLALVELVGAGRRWLPRYEAFLGRRIGGFHYIPKGSREPIGLNLMAGRGSELRWPRDLEGGVFLGFDLTPEQQVFAELAEMIRMRGGNPADYSPAFSRPNGRASNAPCRMSYPMRRSPSKSLHRFQRKSAPA